jgi:hypothetical protein
MYRRSMNRISLAWPNDLQISRGRLLHLLARQLDGLSLARRCRAPECSAIDSSAIELGIRTIRHQAVRYCAISRRVCSLVRLAAPLKSNASLHGSLEPIEEHADDSDGEGDGDGTPSSAKLLKPGVVRKHRDARQRLRSELPNDWRISCEGAARQPPRRPRLEPAVWRLPQPACPCPACAG